MTDTTALTIGQAEIYFREGIASPTSATMPDTQSLGNIVTSGINPDVTYVEHYSRIKGKKVKDEEFVITNGLNINFTFDEINETNIEKFLLGNIADPSTIIDYSASGLNNGTAYGNPTWTNGVKGYALEFDGVDDYVSVPDDASLNFGTGDFTICAWLKTSQEADCRNLFYKGAGSGYSGWRYGLINGIPHILIGDTAGRVEGSFGSTSYADGTWHHLVAVFNRASNAVGYIDGNEIGTISISSISGSVDNTESIIIGNSFDKYDGSLDEVRIYNRALSQEEIINLYNLSNEATTGLVAYYSFPKRMPTMVKNGIRGRSILRFMTDVGKEFLYIIPKCVLKPDGSMELTSDKWIEGNFKLDILYHNTYHVNNDNSASPAPFGYINYDATVLGSPF